MTNDTNKKFFRETIQGAGRGEAKIARRRGLRNEYAHVCISGLEVTDIAVNVEAGSYHDVDSNEPVFREMARKAMVQAIEQAGPILLEAMSLVLITVPAVQVEVVELAVARLGGEATPAVKKEDGTRTLAASVPAAAVDALIEEMLSATRGSATISSRGNGYRPSVDSQESEAQPVVQPTQR